MRLADVGFTPDGFAAVHMDRSHAVFHWNLAPLAGSPEQIAVWSEVITGMELDPNGEVRALDGEAWLQRRKRLEELGGPPKLP